MTYFYWGSCRHSLHYSKQAHATRSEIQKKLTQINRFNSIKVKDSSWILKKIINYHISLENPNTSNISSSTLHIHMNYNLQDDIFSFSSYLTFTLQFLKQSVALQQRDCLSTEDRPPANKKHRCTLFAPVIWPWPNDPDLDIPKTYLHKNELLVN